MRLHSLFVVFPNSDYMFFNKHIVAIQIPLRNTILNKWSNIYSYDPCYKYNKDSYSHLNETVLWSKHTNTYGHACYMILGNKIKDTFEIKYILDKPYSLECDYLSMKKDLSNELNLSIIYNL